MPASNIKRAVEIRSYELQPGTRDAFHALVTGQSVPMLRRWKVDVMAYGPSYHDSDSYFLIRACRDLAECDANQDAFYGSDEWRNGPRRAILAPIRHYTSIILMLDEATIDGLRVVSPS
jgi:hypothetical protein